MATCILSSPAAFHRLLSSSVQSTYQRERVCKARPVLLLSVEPIRQHVLRPRKISTRSRYLGQAYATADVGVKAGVGKKRPGENKGFVEEMRFRAMKLHTKDQAKEGEKEAQAKPLAKWEPTKAGYIQFLVDSKAVYDTMEEIVDKASNPMYATFQKTGLERTEALAKDLAWFESQGHTIPDAGEAGRTYSEYLKKLSETNPPAFICHFYNVYFAHSAGGRMIGKKVAEMILDSRELEFYKWEGDLQELLQSVKDKLNKVAQDWSREEKDLCLEETELSFKYSGQILRVLAS